MEVTRYGLSQRLIVVCAQSQMSERHNNPRSKERFQNCMQDLKNEKLHAVSAFVLFGMFRVLHAGKDREMGNQVPKILQYRRSILSHGLQYLLGYLKGRIETCQCKWMSLVPSTINKLSAIIIGRVPW